MVAKCSRNYFNLQTSITWDETAAYALVSFVALTHVLVLFCNAKLSRFRYIPPIFHQVARSKSGVRFRSSVECSCIIVHVEKCGERAAAEVTNTEAASDERGPAASRGPIDSAHGGASVGDERRQGQRVVWWTSKAHQSGTSGRALGGVGPPPEDFAGEPADGPVRPFPPKATMIATFFPLKKLRRNTRYLLFLAILLAGLAAVYHEMVASKAWSSDASKSPTPQLHEFLLT